MFKASPKCGAFCIWIHWDLSAAKAALHSCGSIRQPEGCRSLRFGRASKLTQGL